MKLQGKSSVNFADVLFESEQPNYLHTFLNTSEITRFHRIINSGKVYHQGLVYNIIA